ncbi:hypothetical protein [Salinirubrum litoreum]|uniref:Uncharacterized protein n=1 Tax=Salinirubrum litoreum TaxID=1126234 RepID=A0ABD5RF28_9EURY|nr:hypothetical protein [Salinirubrum litoreum]
MVELVVLSGCATYPSAHDHVIVFNGEMTRTEGEFRMNGTLNFYLGTAGNRTISNLTVTLYDENRQQISGFDVGTISVNGTRGPVQQRVTIESETAPTYVVIESPDVWRARDVQTSGYVWNGDRYEEYTVASLENRFGE